MAIAIRRHGNPYGEQSAHSHPSPSIRRKAGCRRNGGRTVGELLVNLTTQYSELRKHLYTEDGRLRSFVNVYVNDDDIRYLQKEQTPLRPVTP